MNFKAYAAYQGSKKLYYDLEAAIAAKQKIIALWYKHIAPDAHRVEFPVLIPNGVLKKSGHIPAFNEQLFHIENNDLSLRPETATTIMPHLKQLRAIYKGEDPLKISQIGKAFRDEKTTRDGRYRLREFDQLQLEVLFKKQDNLFQQYKHKVAQFFNALGLEVIYKQLQEFDRAHYSSRTIDIYAKPADMDTYLELGCLNDRGNYDLYDLPAIDRDRLKIFQVSLGLDRIKNLVLLSKVKTQTTQHKKHPIP